MILAKDTKLKYLNRRIDEIEQLKNYCLLIPENINNLELFASIEMIGHKLKGNGSTFGYPELTQLGLAIEEAAKKLDLEKLRELNLKFEERVRNYLRLLNDI